MVFSIFKQFSVTICGKQGAEGTNIFAELYFGDNIFILFTTKMIEDIAKINTINPNIDIIINASLSLFIVKEILKDFSPHSICTTLSCTECFEA